MKDQAPTPDMMGIMYEKRALKRPRLGPPDVYPQEPRQKEDELTSTNVKHGFPTTPHLTDEFGTARNYNVTASKVGAYFNSILAKKEELSTLPDCGRKRQQINPKDNFWPATARTKGAIEAWFKDLAGSKPLAQLAKKAPNFNKKEEIFMSLTEHQVALPRAAWFIKLSSAYTVAVSEAKIKKRQLPDPTTEWTSTLIKFLKDQIPKLTEYYQNTNQGAVPDKTPPSQSGQTTPSHSSSASGGTTPNSNTVPHPMHSPANISGSGGGPICDTGDGKQALRQWTYCVRLAKYLMEEALLERHDFLTWLVDLVDKRTPDDPLLKLFLSLVLQHMGEITQCELLARRLCHSAARKAAAICATLSDHALRQLTQPPGADSPTPAAALSPVADQITSTIADTKPPSVLPVVIKRSTTPAGEAPAPASPPATKQLHPVQASFGEILSCPFHKDVIVQLATVLQITCVECPAALVWSGVGELRSALQGSPLDLLPVPPSSLPMPAMQSHLTATHRRQVYEAEQEISARSKKAESKWCTDKWQTSSQDSETFRLDCGNEKKSLKIAVTFR